MNSVAKVLSQTDRKFFLKSAPASDTEVENLSKNSPVELPNEYFDLLRFSDGFESELALPPLRLCLYEVAYVGELLHDRPFEEIHDRFFIFGGNGGLETIAFDLGNGAPFPVVMIDLIGGEDTSIEIASDFNSFVAAIGIEYRENNEAANLNKTEDV